MNYYYVLCHRIMIPCVTFYILTKDFCLILYNILVHHGNKASVH